jgi:hypothetical protein
MPIYSPVSLYLDESGKFQDCDFVSLGGILITPDTVGPLGAAWAKLLDGEGLAYTSMKDAMHFNGPYKPWRKHADKEKRRDSLVYELARVLSEAKHVRVAACMSSEQFKRLPQQQRKLFKNDLHYAMFESCLKGAFQEMAPYPQTVVVGCDLSTEYSAKCVELFNSLRTGNASMRARFSAIICGDDEKIPALQMADMVAYTVYAPKKGARPQSHIR